MAEYFQARTYFIVVFVICVSHLKSAIGKPRSSWPSLLPPNLQTLDLANRLRDDPAAINIASSDQGNIVKEIPAAVLYPSSIDDIASLIKFAHFNSAPFHIAARGQGHSVRGQAMARNGVVVDMTSFRNQKIGFHGIKVSAGNHPSIGTDDTTRYVDVGGEQLWIDVLNATLEHGLAPVSWTDYLYLTVGGTLSNAGISGQTFRHGPQISNVYEMDVITGKGDVVTCSPENNKELFYAVLGGLGQFGIVARARIILDSAPKRVKWVRMLYDDFSAFSGDQEHLISLNGREHKNAVDYLEGLLLMNHGPLDGWRSSFFPLADHSRITSLITKHGIIYSLEMAKYYYDDPTIDDSVDEELKVLFETLSFIPGYAFEKDVSFVDFLSRAASREPTSTEVHPWLNLFVPKSRISEFNSGVLKNIVLKRNITTGLVLFYPMNKSKWDDRMSAVTPDEDVFYTVGFLHISGVDEWEAIDVQNQDILQYCYNAGIDIKEYLPSYKREKEWENHFGMKWETFQERKARFDPEMIMSPGQRIFNNN
ncbi:hypothetical protein F2P56_002454 [Juglans regia]|uniref:cytokinin dehydrogenase n=2 Tax=Juglans regia TaxID=51240 RepID=A0A833YF80_JUGRE|nr:cytokinin dehydrogenase 3-like [Juglans regia]KAF5481834.1 hypothetical protein F2P56_002454 [Juglans regia]